MSRIKRVAAINDISGVGKCSLTVALPILSSAGIETSVIPTAVLSTHTGGFNDFTYRDLTDDILPIVHHWASLDLKFDSIYTGYLGSIRQIDIVLETIEMLKSDDTLVLVDPVMADAGELYKNFDGSFPNEMKRLCKKADIIVPNITEACLLTGIDYKQGVQTKEYIRELIERLKYVCDKKIVLTGVHFDEENLGCACYDSENGEISYILTEEIEGFYHGTGDVFGSALLAAILNDKSLEEATKIAMTIVVNAIKRTKNDKTDVRFGVRFEDEIPTLIRLLGK
ncbi:MAG: pyridoxamine kinase [Acutalibacteraceae bacterium]